MSYFRNRYRIKGLYLLACTGARIYTFDRTPVQPVQYEQTEHYRLYRDFLADPVAYL